MDLLTPDLDFSSLHVHFALIAFQFFLVLALSVARVHELRSNKCEGRIGIFQGTSKIYCKRISEIKQSGETFKFASVEGGEIRECREEEEVKDFQRPQSHIPRNWSRLHLPRTFPPAPPDLSKAGVSYLTLLLGGRGEGREYRKKKRIRGRTGEEGLLGSCR